MTLVCRVQIVHTPLDLPQDEGQCQLKVQAACLGSASSVAAEELQSMEQHVADLQGQVAQLQDVEQHVAELQSVVAQL